MQPTERLPLTPILSIIDGLIFIILKIRENFEQAALNITKSGKGCYIISWFISTTTWGLLLLAREHSAKILYKKQTARIPERLSHIICEL